MPSQKVKPPRRAAMNASESGGVFTHYGVGGRMKRQEVVVTGGVDQDHVVRKEAAQNAHAWLQPRNSSCPLRTLRGSSTGAVMR